MHVCNFMVCLDQDLGPAEVSSCLAQAWVEVSAGDGTWNQSSAQLSRCYQNLVRPLGRIFCSQFLEPELRRNSSHIAVILQRCRRSSTDPASPCGGWSNDTLYRGLPGYVRGTQVNLLSDEETQICIISFLYAIFHLFKSKIRFLSAFKGKRLYMKLWMSGTGVMRSILEFCLMGYHETPLRISCWSAIVWEYRKVSIQPLPSFN